MSESDSFIEEVSEEVRRDKLFKLFKKYGWVLVVVVIAIVGGTAYNEWDKSQRQTEARLTGDLMRAAVAAQDADALSSIAGENAPAGIVVQIQQASMQADAGNTDVALETLRAVATNLEAAPIYSDLAWLKILILDGQNMSDSERTSVFDRLTAADAPYRLLAQEQRAMQYVRDGNIDAATDDLAAILADPAVPSNLRNRAQQLMVALGGELEQAIGNG